jgi:DHA1 family tetracycline resistance protein-like MFS transporter
MIAGFTGASITTASAYIADISSPEKRAQNFGLIGAAFGLGFILGPLLGGLLAGWGVRMPFFASAALCLLNALYGYFILPESLSKENRRKFSWRRANPLGSFFQLTKYPSISVLIASLILIYIAVHAVQSNWNFYTMYKFGWSEQLIGISLAFVGLLVGGVQGGLIRIILPKIGHEKGVWIGLLFYSIGFMGFAWATESWMMFAFLLPYAMGGIAGPSIQGIISNQVPPSEQGALQGALTSLMSATAIIGPLLMAQLFAYFTSPSAPFQFPGAPMLLGGILTLISAGLAIRGFKRKT